MKEYKQGDATVRVHGAPDKEKLKEAVIEYIKAAKKERAC